MGPMLNSRLSADKDDDTSVTDSSAPKMDRRSSIPRFMPDDSSPKNSTPKNSKRRNSKGSPKKNSKKSTKNSSPKKKGSSKKNSSKPKMPRSISNKRSSLTNAPPKMA